MVFLSTRRSLGLAIVSASLFASMLGVASGDEPVISPFEDGPGRKVLRAGPFSSVWSLALTRDGRTLISGHNQFFSAWDLETRKERYRVQTGKTVRRVDVTPDGATIATAEYQLTGGKTLGMAVVVRDGKTGAARHDMGRLNSGVNSVAISPDGKVAVSSCWGETEIRVWDAEKGENVGSLKGHTGSVTTALFSPDGENLASAGDTTIRLWDRESGGVRKVFRGHKKAIEALAFSPDGKTIASGSYDKTARLWDVGTGKCTATLEHDQAVLTVAFSPDGKTLATACSRWGEGNYDTFPADVRLWDVASAKPVAILPRHSNQVFAMVFTPDGKTLVTSSLSGAITLWDLAALRP